MGNFKLDLLHYIILVGAIMLFTGTVESFIGRYITFLGGRILEFVSMLLVLIVVDKLLHAIFKI